MRISGAEGPQAWRVNGVFDPVEGVSEGMPVYRKRDDADQWLEYYTLEREWVVTSTKSRGTGTGCAWLRSDPPRLPDNTLGSVWEVWDGDDFVDQPSVSVTQVRCICFCFEYLFFIAAVAMIMIVIFVVMILWLSQRCCCIC